MKCKAIKSKPIECCSQPYESDYKIKGNHIYKDGIKYAEVLSSEKNSQIDYQIITAKIVLDNKFLKGQEVIIHLFN